VRVTKTSRENTGPQTGQMTSRAHLASLALVAGLVASCASPPDAGTPPPPLRGIYGGVPQEILDAGTRLRDFGVDAVWLGAGSFTPERLALLRAEQMQVYAEFNTRSPRARSESC
jgi:hypothetical protein